MSVVRDCGRLAAVALLAFAPSHYHYHAHYHSQLQFVPHEVATGLRGGYQVIATDMNRDGKPDLVAVASSVPDLVWFENPGWERRVLATGLTGMINVAAADLDGDSIPELALAHGFGMTVARSRGSVALLTHGDDVRQPWKIREIDQVPTSHRLRWMKRPGRDEFWLLNAPLIGDTVIAPEYRGNTPIYFYRSPDWKRELFSSAEEGVVHAIETVPNQPVASLWAASFRGAGFYTESAAGVWLRAQLVPPPAANSAAEVRTQVSEIAVVSPAAHVTVEPWHGNSVVLYRTVGDRRVERSVIDSTLTDAHTLLTADFDGDGRREIVAGERGGQRSVRIYNSDATGAVWTRTLLDAGLMAAAGCAAADFNGDGRLDLACIGTATANLKWYENVRR